MGILKKGGVFAAGLLFFLRFSLLSAQVPPDSLPPAPEKPPAAAGPGDEVFWEESWHNLPGKPRPIVSQIIFSGNRAFPAARLKSKIATRKDSFWGRTGLSFGQHRRAAKDWVYKDVGLLTAFYRSRGFLDAGVLESFYHDTVKNELWVRLEISEGKASFFGPASLSGDPGELAGKLQEAASELKPDSAFNVYLVDRAVFRMKEILANSGYPYAKIFLDTVRAAGEAKLPMVFRIEKDGLVHFGRVEIAGLASTEPVVVRRELAFKPGDVYSRQKIIQSQQQVYATGLFNFVSLALRPKEDSLGAQGDTLSLVPDFVLRAVERKPAALNLHVGAGQFKLREEQQDLSVDLAVGWENRNLGGRGRRFSLSGLTSFLVITDYRLLSNKISTDYTEPWLLGTRNYATVSASFEPAVKDRVLGVRIQTAALGLTFFRPITLTTRLSLGMSLEEINIFDVPLSQLEQFKEEKGINVRRSVSASFEKDTRSNILIPTGGSYTRLEGALLGGPLGGDANFFKVNLYWNRYQELAGRNILATRLRWGQAFLIGDRGNLPITDRFFLGGANSLRGYAENSLGPVFIDSTGKAIPAGGKTLFLTSLEIRRPLFWRFWGNLFSDFGNIFQANRDIVPDNILVTVGGGVEFLTLIGPLRVEYGKRVIHGDQSSGERVHFSILFAF